MLRQGERFIIGQLARGGKCVGHYRKIAARKGRVTVYVYYF